jgi:hypothetical protein
MMPHESGYRPRHVTCVTVGALVRQGDRWGIMTVRV